MPPSWLPSSIIYQVFTGRWNAQIYGNQITRRETFRDLQKHNWQRLQSLGINTIYLLGIWDNRGPILVHQEEGLDLPSTQFLRVPSIFAITDHTQPHPDLGTLTDLQNLITHLHSLNFKVILDFVPNHTSTTHPWVTSHPEYYYQVKSNNEAMQQFNNFLPEFSGDVYKLNYDNSELRSQMLEIIRTICSYGIDGLRVDMAHYVPHDFWLSAIYQIKSDFPYIAFIAEAYPNHPFDYSNIHSLLDSGFDAIYNKSFYHTINQIIVNHSPLIWLVDSLNSIPVNFSSQLETSKPRLPVQVSAQKGNFETNLNFFSNHDDPLPAEALAKAGPHLLESLLTLLLFTPGVPLIYNGSLLGLDHRLAHHWFEPLPLSFLETENSLPDHLLQLFHLRLEHHPYGVASQYFQALEQAGNLILQNRDHRGVPYQFSLSFK